MIAKLTIQEKLKDLRTERGLTLEELADQVKIARSTLGNYENDEYKEISHYSIIALAEFYGVSTDYLLGLTENREPVTSSVEGLHLDDETIALLTGNRFNTRLLCEMIKHPVFGTFLQDLEILVDGHAAMQIASLNFYVDYARQAIKEKYDPDKNDIYMKTLEAAHIDENQYFYTQLHNDIEMIVRDIRKKHAGDSTSSPDESPTIQNVKNAIEEYNSFQGSAEENQARFWLRQYGIKYDALTPYEFAVLIGILKKSPILKQPSSGRGRKRKKKK